MDNDSHFSGSRDALFQYWQEPSRAKKFTNGGTRTRAIQYLIDRIETDIHKGVWLDTAIGAGFVQTQLSKSVSPCALIGLDLSRSMLEEIEVGNILRVLGSAFTLPFRQQSVTLSSSIFCLSDYPTPQPVLNEMARTLIPTGILVYIDYAETDDYWTMRKKLHGTLTKTGKIVGNIHLRNLETIKKYLPGYLRLVHKTIIEYQVNSSGMKAKFELPEIISRKFLYIEMYKHRSR